MRHERHAVTGHLHILYAANNGSIGLFAQDLDYAGKIHPWVNKAMQHIGSNGVPVDLVTCCSSCLTSATKPLPMLQLLKWQHFSLLRAHQHLMLSHPIEARKTCYIKTSAGVWGALPGRASTGKSCTL